MPLNDTHSQRTIVVEARKDPRPALMLDALADGCANLGLNVIRWRGPLSGRLPYSRWLPPCDAAILFNGAHPAYEPVLARLRTWQAATLFVELGWYPQAGHYQIDPNGVNASTSWCIEPLDSGPLLSDARTPVTIRPYGDLLVLLQLEHDTQITTHSPWFTSMSDFVRHIATYSALPVRVRPHPLEPNKPALRRLVQDLGCAWDDTVLLADSLRQAKAIATINSSAAVEALHQQLPILCYGSAVYRNPTAVYCLTNDPAQTQMVTSSLQAGNCDLASEAMHAMLVRIQSRQWQPTDVPTKLPALLQSLTWPKKRPTDDNTSLKKAYQWMSDLPARILYRHRWRETVGQRKS